MDRVGLDRGTQKERTKSCTVHIVHGRASVYGDEDGIDQIKEEDDGKFQSFCCCGESAKELKDVVALGKRSDTHRH